MDFILAVIGLAVAIGFFRYADYLDAKRKAEEQNYVGVDRKDLL